MPRRQARLIVLGWEQTRSGQLRSTGIDFRCHGACGAAPRTSRTRDRCPHGTSQVKSCNPMIFGYPPQELRNLKHYPFCRLIPLNCPRRAGPLPTGSGGRNGGHYDVGSTNAIGRTGEPEPSPIGSGNEIR